MFLRDIIPSLLCIHCHNLYEEYGSVEKLKKRSTSRRLEWVMWKMRQKTVQWKNVSRQGCEDICTANFNYEHWPLSFSASLPSFLLSLTDQLVKWKRKHWRARWLEEAGKLRHHIETHSETEQMDTHTKKNSTCTLRLSSSFAIISVLSHPLCFQSFFPMFPFSLVPLVASVFHFKLDCRDPKLIGCWARSETKNRKKEGQTDSLSYTTWGGLGWEKLVDSWDVVVKAWRQTGRKMQNEGLGVHKRER